MTSDAGKLDNEAQFDATTLLSLAWIPSDPSATSSPEPRTEDSLPALDMNWFSSSLKLYPKHGASASEQSTSQDGEPISYAEVVSAAFFPAKPDGTDNTRAGLNSATGESSRATFLMAGRMTHRSWKASVPKSFATLT